MRPFDKIRIQYKKEIKFGDVVKCRYTFEDGKHVVFICDKDENLVHAIIILEQRKSFFLLENKNKNEYYNFIYINDKKIKKVLKNG